MTISNLTYEPEHLSKCILCDSSSIHTFNSELLLSKCAECGLIFDNPRPDISAIKAFYSSSGMYGQQECIRRHRNKNWQRVLSRLLKYKINGKLLDIGAGTGDFLAFARKHFEVNGCEVSSVGVSIAKEVYGLHLHESEVEQTPFSPATFDVISLCQVLEHIPFPGRTLRRCKQLLAPGGILYIAVPNEAWYSLRILIPRLGAKLKLAAFRHFKFKGHRRIDFKTMQEIHISHFSETTLKKALYKSGFEVIQSGIDFLDPFASRRGLVQIPRHILYLIALIVKVLTGRNVYNCLWMIARIPRS